ncbi:LysR family transcriptional regulator [bacterium]|nr:LysR family transcriptional regulator [bacterium]
MKLNTFDLNLLRVFDAILQEGSVSIAAERLGLTQSAVSNALSRLRQHTGDPLFIRSRDGMIPTAYAQRMGKSVTEAFAMIRAGLSGGANFEPAQSTREFRILLSDVGEQVILPPLIELVARGGPAIRLKIDTLADETYHEALQLGFADLGMGFVHGRAGFAVSELFNSTNGVAFRADHPEFGKYAGGTLPMESYLQAAHVALERKKSQPTLFEIQLQRQAIRRNSLLAVPRLAAVPHILSRTNYIATAPLELRAIWFAQSRVEFAALPIETEPQPVSLIWHNRQDSDPGHLWLRELIISYYKHPAWRLDPG